MAKKNTVLKKLKFGIEIELFTLDKNGYMIDAGRRLIEAVNRMYPEVIIKKESSASMVEINSGPSTNIPELMTNTLNDFEKVIHVAEKEDIVLFAYGTYPGTCNPKTQDDPRYHTQEKIYGKNRYAHSKRCIGLHFHFSLPRGVFDYEQKIIKTLFSSKNQDSMLNMYNLFIAMDPALTTFAQSSPFYQGKRLGKDARIITRRGGDLFNYPQGLYGKYQEYGDLQKYRHSGSDLLSILMNTYYEWNLVLEKMNFDINRLMKRGSILESSRHPVKLSAFGTLEHKGLDINNPRIIIALATLIEYISRDVQEKFVDVVVSKDAKKYPFKKIGNTIYIPPDDYVRFKLQPKAAYKGLESNMVYEYCKGLLELGKTIVPKKIQPLLEPLEEMISKKETVSDRIINQAKKRGIKDEMTPKEAASFALALSKDLYKDIILTKQIIKNLK